MDNKIKVAILCHFTNIEIQKHLPLRKSVKEFAPWIFSTINELQNRKDVEIHIISPHEYLIRNISFKINNIYFHFFTTGIPIIHRHWPGFFRLDYLTNFRNNTNKIKKIINKISPDLIHLYGAENAYFASSFMHYIHRPHLVTIQGFLYLVSSLKLTYMIRKRVAIETEIYSKAKNFGIRYSFMEDEIKKLNPEPKFFWHHIPVNVYVPESFEKTYDLVFFARLTKVKGVEDFIKAIGLIAKLMPDIKAKIIGPASEHYRNYLKELAIKSGSSENIEFLGFINTQNELHEIVAKAKICVLPTYNDTVPGTIVESMMLGTAVVSYNTGGIPGLNSDVKTVEIVEQGDLNGLAARVIYLLTDDKERLTLVSNAKKIAEERYNPQNAINDLVNLYNLVLKESKLETNEKAG
jgi:glycosyltransferase involved in cell wall biosynthesis